MNSVGVGMHSHWGDFANLVWHELRCLVAPATVQDVVFDQSADPQLTIVLHGPMGLNGAALLTLGRKMRAALPPDVCLPQITIQLRPDEPAAPEYPATVAGLVGAVVRAPSLLSAQKGKRRRRLPPSTPFHNLRSLRRAALP